MCVTFAKSSGLDARPVARHYVVLIAAKYVRNWLRKNLFRSPFSTLDWLCNIVLGRKSTSDTEEEHSFRD